MIKSLFVRFWEPPVPSQELVQAARERAQDEADERGLPIDRICIQASPNGEMYVHVLDD